MIRRTTALLLTLASFSFAAPLPKEDRKESWYFPTTEGTTLVYQVGNNEETRVIAKVEKNKDGDNIVHVSSVNTDGKQTPCMVVLVSKKGLYLLEETGQKYDPPWCILKTPIKAGETWDIKTTRPELGGLTLTQTVGEAEMLKVPYGTVTAVPVDNSLGQVNWFAPDIGWTKITLKGKTYKELKSFKLGEKK